MLNKWFLTSNWFLRQKQTYWKSMKKMCAPWTFSSKFSEWFFWSHFWSHFIFLKSEATDIFTKNHLQEFLVKGPLFIQELFDKFGKMKMHQIFSKTIFTKFITCLERLINESIRLEIHELRVQLYELQVQIHVLRVQIYELWVQIYELQVQIHELWV